MVSEHWQVPSGREGEIGKRFVVEAGQEERNRERGWKSRFKTASSLVGQNTCLELKNYS